MIVDNTCGNCLYWNPVKPFYADIRSRGECKLMSKCFCCNHGTPDKPTYQIAGAIGGGSFESFASFGCNQWRIDSRAKHEIK